MASKHITIYLDTALWQTFRLACLGRNISASHAVTDLIIQQLHTWTPSSASVKTVGDTSTARERITHGDLC
jgi:hypothetical protein